MKYFIVIACMFLIFPGAVSAQSDSTISWWDIQSIDTMKYSRDIAREKLKDESFDEDINKQVELIAKTGATHIAIATPYDEEFIPYLTRWVTTARKYNLNVWFRGNFSGWEEWFGYDEMTPEEHTKLTEDFIFKHSGLFRDGDLFTSCPECENGAMGDPRLTGEVSRYRNFLITEYKVTKRAFQTVGKNVQSNLYSMNGDIARLIMDKETTKALDGIVVVDHYVGTPQQLNDDVTEYARSSGGKIVLGEFGAPIPDIHGNMSEEEQKQWLQEALRLLSQNNALVGVNYWTHIGGSTALWKPDGTAKTAVSTLTNFYSPKVIKGTVVDEIGFPINQASIQLGSKTTLTDRKGQFSAPYVISGDQVTVIADGYRTTNFIVEEGDEFVLSLQKEKEGFLFRFAKSLYKFFSGIFA